MPIILAIVADVVEWGLYCSAFALCNAAGIFDLSSVQVMIVALAIVVFRVGWSLKITYKK